MNILMIGFNISLLESLERYDEPFVVTVIEEPDLYANKNLQQYSFQCLKQVVFSEYQQSTSFLEALDELTGDSAFDVVVPGLEYAVEATVKAAQKLGLPHAGEIASKTLTNKYQLRMFCAEQNIPHPRFAKIESLDDLCRFYQGNPIVLKPANRQASLGVIKIKSDLELEDAWKEVLQIDEGVQVASRDMEWQYLAEECMTGLEISTEVFVSNGEVLFINCTSKETTSGRYSVELGHMVPALISSEIENQLRIITNKLVTSLCFGYGVLHAEWMFTTDEGPKLIECAGRAPGDSIFEMIELAYGFDPYLSWVNVLSGKTPVFPQLATRGAAIKFFSSETGKVQQIEGIENLVDPDLKGWEINIKTGDEIKPIKSSWDRIGYVLTTGENSLEANKLAEKMISNISITVSKKAKFKRGSVGNVN